MKYYVPKNDYYVGGRGGYTFIKSELITENEMLKLKSKFNRIDLHYFDIIDISKNRTYISFGVRKYR